MNLALPDLRIASAVSLNSWLLTRLIASSSVCVVAQPVDEEEVDVVGPQGRQPLVDHLEHLRRRCGMSLVTRKISLRTSGVLLEPLLEVGLGAVDLGGVERRGCRWRRRAGGSRSTLGPRTAPCSSIVISTPVLPSFRRGQRLRLRGGGILALRRRWPGSRPRPSRARRPGGTCGDPG